MLKYGGVQVSTWELSRDCMQRISVGLFKKPVKTIIAKSNDNSDKVVAVDFSPAALAVAA